jgi:hypothetical protein
VAYTPPPGWTTRIFLSGPSATYATAALRVAPDDPGCHIRKMPFTPAHPAAVVPLFKVLRERGSPTALVIGSMAPDLAYFLPVSVARGQSHSPWGVVWFCIPVCALAYVCFHVFLAPLVHGLVPRDVGAHFPESWSRGKLPNDSPAIVLSSFLLGVFTHLAWDSFTHKHGLVVASVPALSVRLFRWQGYTFSAYKFLQHGSTLVGMALLAWWGWRWLRRTVGSGACLLCPAQVRALAVLLGPSLVAMVYAGFDTKMGARGPLRQAGEFAIHAVRAGGTVFLMWVLALGMLWRFFGAKQSAA